MFTLTTAQQNALSAQYISVAFFAELEFRAATIRFTTWNQSLVWGGNTWIGAGTLSAINDVKEMVKLESSPIDLTLNIADPAILALTLVPATDYRGKNARLYICPMVDGVLVDVPVMCWNGTLDQMVVDVGKDGGGSVTVRCKPSADRLQRPRNLRLNNITHQNLSPGSLGMVYQADLLANPQLWLSKKFQKSGLA